MPGSASPPSKKMSKSEKNPTSILSVSFWLKQPLLHARPRHITDSLFTLQRILMSGLPYVFMNRVSQVFMGVAPRNTPVCPQATFIHVTHTFNVMLQKHFGNWQHQSPPSFFRIFEQKKMTQKNTNDVIRPGGHPMMPKRETKQNAM